jgi:hypothetical protein
MDATMEQLPADQFYIEYSYSPSPDADERIASALNLILELLLEDYKEFPDSDSSTPENAK